MSLPVEPLDSIPDLTRRIAQTSFPKGTLAMHLRDELGSIYHNEEFADLFPKRGRPAEAPWRLALVTVLQAVENLSDRQAAEMVRGRLDWKYALSLSLDDSGFDASILTDFRQRLVDQQAQERLLEPILAVCRQHGWLKAGGTQRVDSTMVLANARRLSSLESVGETLRAALNALAETEPEWLLTVIEADWFDRYVHRFELQRFPKGKLQQEALREQVGRDGRTLLQAVQQPDAPPSLHSEPLVAALERVWQQHFEEYEGQVRWRDGPVVSNAERVVSPYDQQARDSRKRSTEWLGYKVHLTETCDADEAVHLIVDVRTTPATRQDVEETLPLLDRLAEHELLPRVLAADMGYTCGSTLVQGQQQGVRILGPVQQDHSWQAQQGYGLASFAIDWQVQQACCPQGHLSQTWRPGVGKRGEEMIQVFFAPTLCQGCEVKALCTTSETGGRSLTLYPQPIHEALQQRRGEQGRAEFQQEYQVRSGIESSLSQGVRRSGMRQCRYRGEPKTQLQMTAIAAAINLVRLQSYLQRCHAGLPPRRTRVPSPFARLQERKIS